jgi:predicted N-formylglutamate amidohydrolase
MAMKHGQQQPLANALLGPGDPEPVVLRNPAGRSPILFISDHGGRAVPRRLGRLGLSEAELARHIGWDIGIQGVTSRLSDKLDATYIYQPYSRLVIDCNRKVGSAQSIMERSDGVEVPGNRGLSEAEKQARDIEIMRPYHRCIEETLARRRAAGQPTVIFCMHSCTPHLASDAEPRPWHIGVIAYRDWRIGDSLLALLEAEPGLCVGRNEPYSVNLEMDYTVPVHCEGRGAPYAEIEIRQDLIGDEAGQRRWAALLEPLLPRSVERSEVLAA